MGSNLDKERDQLASLNFTEKELKKLYKNFSEIDKDKNGSLEPEEFFDIPELA
jgi:Ca2+-binding EF-hand superfamily protein